MSTNRAECRCPECGNWLTISLNKEAPIYLEAKQKGAFEFCMEHGMNKCACPKEKKYPMEAEK